MRESTTAKYQAFQVSDANERRRVVIPGHRTGRHSVSARRLVAVGILRALSATDQAGLPPWALFTPASRVRVSTKPRQAHDHSIPGMPSAVSRASRNPAAPVFCSPAAACQADLPVDFGAVVLERDAPSPPRLALSTTRERAATILRSLILLASAAVPSGCRPGVQRRDPRSSPPVR